MARLDAQDRGLYAVQTRIDSDFVVVIAAVHAVVDDPADPVGQLVVVGKDGSAVPVAAQVFGGEERGGSQGADRACFLGRAVGEDVFRSDGLGRVLDDGQ